MKYIKEYSEFINEGYINVPNNILDIFDKIYNLTIVEYSKDKKNKLINFIGIFNSISNEHINDFGCIVNLSYSDANNGVLNKIINMFIKNKSITNTSNYKDVGIKYAGYTPTISDSKRIFIDKNDLNKKIIDEESMILIILTDDFINNYDNINVKKIIKNIFKHEYGHKMVNDLKINIDATKYFAENPGEKSYMKKINISDIGEPYDDIKGLNPDNLKSPDESIPNTFQSIKNKITTYLISKDVSNYIKMATTDNYGYKEIIDIKHGPLSTKKYAHFLDKYKNDPMKRYLFIYTLQSDMYDSVKHDSSREEFSVDVNVITSELLNVDPNIKNALKIISTSQRPNTPSPTFNTYLRTIGNKSKDLKILRKYLYVSLQDVAKKMGQNSGGNLQDFLKLK